MTRGHRKRNVSDKQEGSRIVLPFDQWSIAVMVHGPDDFALKMLKAVLNSRNLLSKGEEDTVAKFLAGNRDVGLKKDQVRNKLTSRKQLAGQQ